MGQQEIRFFRNFEKVNFRVPRSVWMKPRLKVWWQHHKTYAHEDQWVEKFRMIKETFQEIHSFLKEHLQPSWNPLQPDRAVESDEQLAI